MHSPVTVEGNLVDVLEDRTYPARIRALNGRITSVEEIEGTFSNYILPGLVDSHVHVESSMLVPSRFAELAVPRGVVAVVADPHEIANVLGIKGVEFMIKDSESVPLKFRYMAPSCVPATGFETAGCRLGSKEIEDLLSRPKIFGLAEVMNYPGVINRDPEVMEKIAIAKKYNKPIDGHAPGLSGNDLDKYIAAGITTDHECVTEEEAREKAEKGMIIQVREGSACSNMEALIPVAKDYDFFFSTDDMQANDCINNGYMDKLLRMAVAFGIEPMRAIKAASLWPSLHYGLRGGAIYKDGPADLVIVSDLKDFDVLKVYINGTLVAENGKITFNIRPLTCDTNIVTYHTVSKDFYIYREVDSIRVKVIGVEDKKIYSTKESAVLRTDNGILMPDVDRDVLLMAVVNRYEVSKPTVGFVTGFGLKKGALASTVSHDSHNIVVVATSYELLSKAVNAVSIHGGHYVTDGMNELILPLPVAGLMTTEPGISVAAIEQKMIVMAESCGCKFKAPFMTLGFQCLLVVPALKMSDKGLFDNTEFKFTELDYQVE